MTPYKITGGASFVKLSIRIFVGFSRAKVISTRKTAESRVKVWKKMGYVYFIWEQKKSTLFWSNSVWNSNRNSATICSNDKVPKVEIFKNLELYWSNLPQNSNCGRELVQKSGVQIPIGEGQIFLSSFLFIFLLKKLNIDT